MGEIVFFLLGGGLVALGYALPHRTKKETDPVKGAFCGCGHHLSMHAKDGTSCNAFTGELGGNMYDDQGRYVGVKRIVCKCAQYVGPIPDELILANFVSRSIG